MDSLNCRNIGCRPKTHRESKEIRNRPLVGQRQYRIILPISESAIKVNSKIRSINRKALKERSK